MTDELKKQLTENFEQLVPTEFTNPTMYDSLLKVYLAGGEHGYQYAVEKAMVVLRDDIFVSDDIIELFKRVMED